ncbi:hypothetical protein ABZY09_12045 [Streptomyces sp. NPDC002928]|uniref:hypothetical protein n=1 Tax=Streptomyces sp. NPDC002928 TaxID=3154440 RepID=UPI0033A82199
MEAKTRRGRPFAGVVAPAVALASLTACGAGTTGAGADARVLGEPWPHSAWPKTHRDTAVKVARTLQEAARRTESVPKAAATATRKATKTILRGDAAGSVDAAVPVARTVKAVEWMGSRVREFTSRGLQGSAATARLAAGTGKATSGPDGAKAPLRGRFTPQTKGS